MISADEPFLHPVAARWIPSAMLIAPTLDPSEPGESVEPHFALLINPFYPKDANASFGKHVLTPTLALTSIAATTPAHWRVRVLGREPARRPPPFVRCRRWSASPSI